MSAPASGVRAKDFDRVTQGVRYVDPAATADERVWATLIHLAGFTYLFAGPLSIIAPLVLWLIKREKSAFIDDHGKEAVNFQISIWIWGVVSAILFMCGIGVVMMLGIFVLSTVYMIMYAVRANAGEYVRYPITIRFIQ